MFQTTTHVNIQKSACQHAFEISTCIQKNACQHAFENSTCMGQERLGPSYIFISLVLGPLNSLVWYVPSLRYTRDLGWRIHCGVEVTESSTNKQHHLCQKKVLVSIKRKCMSICILNRTSNMHVNDKSYVNIWPLFLMDAKQPVLRLCSAVANCKGGRVCVVSWYSIQ
jgi:hypothetical protein